MRKTFILTMLGRPFPWIDQFIDHVQHLEKYGWQWKIFTPNPIPSRGNVEIVPMTTEQFNDLVEQKMGVRPQMFMTEYGVPSVHVTDFYIFSGLIFEDHLKDSDFWGITNLDVVYGRLDHFLPDSYLEDCDVFTDDVNAINGVFSLFRNTEKINNLCKQIGNWQEIISQPPCPYCTLHQGDRHVAFGSDEYGMTEVMKQQTDLRYKYPLYYPLHSYDRLETQVPKIKLDMKEDGTLFELSEDTQPPQWIHAHKYIGREILFYHFIMSKTWPLK